MSHRVRYEPSFVIHILSVLSMQKRKIIRTEDVIDAKKLQLRKELDDIDADIERVSTSDSVVHACSGHNSSLQWRQYVLHISNQLCTQRMVSPLQLVRMLGMDFGKARSYGVDIAFED